jgi:hypothetical protein
MPSIVNDEESILLIVIGHEVCYCSVGLNLRQSIRGPAINENALHIVVIGVFKNALEAFDL